MLVFRCLFRCPVISLDAYDIDKKYGERERRRKMPYLLFICFILPL